MGRSKSGADIKGDRALELHEKGVDHAAIAERLGIRPSNLYVMLHEARLRRTKKAEFSE